MKVLGKWLMGGVVVAAAILLVTAIRLVYDEDDWPTWG